MAADLHIHIFEDGMLISDLESFFSTTIGSKWFNPSAATKMYDSPEYERVAQSPNVWIGAVSWLKAALFDDAETFVPHPVARVAELVGEDLPVIDDALIIQIGEALDLPNQSDYYEVAEKDNVVAFLTQYKGKQAFTISW